MTSVCCFFFQVNSRIPQTLQKPWPMVVDLPPGPAVVDIVVLDILQTGEQATTAGTAALL